MSSPASSCIGAPKVTEHRIGTGTTSPLGMTRCTLSIHAGISGTSGNCSARWYSPLLNGCGSPLLLRVPSGKMTSESPLLQRLDQRLERVFVVGARAAHVHRVEHLARQPVLERRRRPVVARGDRPRRRAQLARQRGPDQHPVEVALVVGEVDALLGLRRAAFPVALRAGDQAGDEGEQSRAPRQRHGRDRAAPGSARRLPAATACQCRKCRTPVNTIATPRSSAAAITSSSRIAAAGLDHAARAGVDDDVEAVAEREERVARDRRAGQRQPGVLRP